MLFSFSSKFIFLTLNGLSVGYVYVTSRGRIWFAFHGITSKPIHRFKIAICVPSFLDFKWETIGLDPIKRCTTRGNLHRSNIGLTPFRHFSPTPHGDSYSTLLLVLEQLSVPLLDISLPRRFGLYKNIKFYDLLNITLLY